MGEEINSGGIEAVLVSWVYFDTGDKSDVTEAGCESDGIGGQIGEWPGVGRRYRSVRHCRRGHYTLLVLGIFAARPEPSTQWR